MTSSAFKLFILSLVFFLASSAAASYIIYKQEMLGEELLKRSIDIQSWERAVMAKDNLDIGTEGKNGLQAQLRSFVLLSEADTIAFLSVVEDTVVAAGAEVRTVELKKEKTADTKFDELAVTFSLRGEASSVERALKLLEVLPYRSRVEKLTLTRGDVSSEASVVIRVSTIQ